MRTAHWSTDSIQLIRVMDRQTHDRKSGRL